MTHFRFKPEVGQNSRTIRFSCQIFLVLLQEYYIEINYNKKILRLLAHLGSIVKKAGSGLIFKNFRKFGNNLFKLHDLELG